MVHQPNRHVTYSDESRPASGPPRDLDRVRGPAPKAVHAWRAARHPSGLGQRDAALALVLAAAVLVAGLADLVALEEQHLRATLAGVDLGRQRRGVGELEPH